MKLGGVPRKKLERAADLAIAGHAPGVIASRTLLTLSVCREIHAAYLRVSRRENWLPRTTLTGQGALPSSTGARPCAK